MFASPSLRTLRPIRHPVRFSATAGGGSKTSIRPCGSNLTARSIAAAVAAPGFVKDRRAVSHGAARPLPIAESPTPAGHRRCSCRNSRRLASADADDRVRPERARMAQSATTSDYRSWFREKACWVIAVGTTRIVPLTRPGIGHGNLVHPYHQRRAVPRQLAWTDRKSAHRAADRMTRPLGHGPTICAFAIDRNIDRAMVERIGNAFAPSQGIIRRKHTADESDDGDAALAVVAQRVDVPPRIAVGVDHPCEVRSASRLEAAERPDRAAIGTPGPGCVLPPAR